MKRHSETQPTRVKHNFQHIVDNIPAATEAHTTVVLGVLSKKAFNSSTRFPVDSSLNVLQKKYSAAPPCRVAQWHSFDPSVSTAGGRMALQRT